MPAGPAVETDQLHETIHASMSAQPLWRDLRRTRSTRCWCSSRMIWRVLGHLLTSRRTRPGSPSRGVEVHWQR